MATNVIWNRNGTEKTTKVEQTATQVAGRIDSAKSREESFVLLTHAEQEFEIGIPVDGILWFSDTD